MNIGQHILGSYDANIQNGNVHLEHVRGEEQVSAANPTADISGLKEGAVFKGEIMDIAGEKVTIALENKAQLFARLQTGVELGVGDILLFSVKENTSSQILLKPMFDSLYSAQTQVLEKALNMAGLSPTEKNFSATKELMEAGMPVDKDSLVKLLSQSIKFEGTSMQTLVALNKLNIPVTEANIAQYARYQNYSHQLSGDIMQTAEGMASFAEAFPEETPGAVLLSVAEQLITIFSGETDNTAAMNSKLLFAGNDDVTANVTDSLNTEDASVVKDSEMNAAFIAESSISDTAVTEKEAMNVRINASSDLDISRNMLKTDNTINIQSETAVYEQMSGNIGLTKDNIVNLGNMLQKAGIPEQQVKAVLLGSDSTEDLLNNLTQLLSQNGGNDAAIRNILVSFEFKKLISDMVKNRWSLDPKLMKNPKEIDELYERILKQTASFKEVIASRGGEWKDFNQSSQNMRQNMQFMEQLNNQMIYAQMPLKLSNQNANSELYVYADKRKLMEKKDGISVVLHLDMDYLGMTDIKVTLTGTNVNARFYLNDQESVDIITDNMEQLAEQLSERGFSLTNEVIMRAPQESVNMVVDEIIDENAERSIKRYTFDMRT